jgi:uncharacterized protein (TIGR02466 family)
VSDNEDVFEPIDLFAFPLFSAMIAGWESHQEALVDEILEHRAKDRGVVRSNRDGWHSGDAFTERPSEHLRWVLSNVTRYAHRALAPFYDDWATSELRLGHFWANVLTKGGWNAPHHHYPQHWSGTYYVRVGSRAGREPGDIAGMIEFLNPFPIQSHWGGGSFAYAPRDGLQLLFPAPLVHLVHPHQDDFERISIAYNFNVVPKVPR